MNEAIKLAIEKGGYEPFKSFHMEYCKQVHYMDGQLVVEPGAGGTATRLYLAITQDPAFWQALGRALGWGKHVGEFVPGKMYETNSQWEWDIVQHPWQHKIEEGTEKWLYHALRYFELVLTQGDTEAFWKDLLKEKGN